MCYQNQNVHAHEPKSIENQNVHAHEPKINNIRIWSNPVQHYEHTIFLEYQRDIAQGE